jgi:hypothetical protein
MCQNTVDNFPMDIMFIFPEKVSKMFIYDTDLGYI